MAIQSQLIPVQELAAGQIGVIRNQVVNFLVSKASTELKMSPEQLVVRDIRPYSDLYWGTYDDKYSAAILTTDLWNIETHSSGEGAYRELVGTSHTTMADQKFVGIYGIRDGRFSMVTVEDQCSSLWKFDVGHSTKAIWDLSKCYAYRSMIAGVCPSAVIIPQNTYYQIYGYLLTASDNSRVMLEGVVVEPRGVTISP